MLGTGQNPVFAVCLCFCLVRGSQKQWWIQDLVRVWPKENERNWTERGDGRPLDPPMKSMATFPSTTTPLESQTNARLIFHVSFVFTALNIFLNLEIYLMKMNNSTVKFKI